MSLSEIDPIASSNYSELLDKVDVALRSEQHVQVRRRIFRQLFETLLYEGVIPAETEASGEWLCFRIQGSDPDGVPVVYRCCGRRRQSFGRIKLNAEPVTREVSGNSSEAASLAQCLLELPFAPGADPQRRLFFVRELEETLLKDTLAQYQRARRGEPLRDQPYEEQECLLADGHPYHPSYKSRIGFDLVDNLLFGPEFSAGIKPFWVAAHRDWTRVAVSQRFGHQAFIRHELGEAVWTRFAREIRERGCNPDEYLFLPVHPWQWRERAASAFQADLQEGRLIPLGMANDVYRAQQSIRTLANASDLSKAYLKLSLSIHNTSTSRILAPHTVVNAPAISDWLQCIRQKDAFLRDELKTVFLGEVLGVAYNPPRPEFLQDEVYGVLSCIWRESLHPALEPGEAALPFNALCHVDVDGRPLIEPWIRQHGMEPWLQQLLTTSILPVVHLLQAHGIALEAHAQNMVLIHRGGAPCRLALRDFHDGIRFAPALLSDPSACPVLLSTPEHHARVNRNSYIETDRAEEVRDFVLDAFFFINLGELALFLADQFGFSESRFWALAHEVVTRYERDFGFTSKPRFDLYAATVQVEQLTKRRLYPETEVRVHAVPNPLAMVRDE